MELNEKKIRKVLGFGRKKTDNRNVIAKCGVCGKPLLGVSFLNRYRAGSLKLRERYVIKNIIVAGKLGLKSAKLVGVDVSHLKIGSAENDLIGGIFAYHFAFSKDKEHKEICQKVIDVGGSGPITSNIDWNPTLKTEHGLDAAW